MLGDNAKQGVYWKEGDICILCLKRIRQCNQLFTCQQFQRDQKTHTCTHIHTIPRLTNTWMLFFHRRRACTGFCMGLLSCMLNWKQVQRKDLITFAAHYPVTVCTYLPLCVLINQAQTTLSAPLHFSTWLATSNSRAQQPDETTCCCLRFQHLQCKRS